jgi:hypothetical protein
MLVLAMQFSRSADAGDTAPGPETRTPARPLGPRRRSLEVKEGRSLKTEERTVVGPGLRHREETPTTDGIAVDQTERGSNWESSLRCAGTLTP